MKRSPFDWLFRNRRTNEITIAQFPNAALWVFFATVVLRWIVDADGDLHRVVSWIGVIALAWWAVDEVVRGVNPWRRLLGLAGCVLVVARVISLL